MDKEELIKNQFPNDEFLRSAVSQIVDKCTAELEKENKVLAQNLEDTEIINKTYEKRFDDLKKENAELRNNGFTVSAMTEQQLKVALEKGEQLEKENAELKKQLGMSNKVYNDNLDYSHHIDDQLTKAKDLLKQWLQTSKASGCDNINIVTDTEQFLSEVEK